MVEMSDEDKLKLLKFAREQIAPQDNAGEIYATRFESVLEELKQQGKIVAWRATEKNGEEDAQGIDYWIHDGEQEIPFQISGSRMNSSSQRRMKKSGKLASQAIPEINVLGKKTGLMKRPEMLGQEVMNGMAMHRLHKAKQSGGF